MCVCYWFLVIIGKHLVQFFRLYYVSAGRPLRFEAHRLERGQETDQFFLVNGGWIQGQGVLIFILTQARIIREMSRQ